MVKVEYCGKIIEADHRTAIEEQISLICDIAERLKIPYKTEDNMTIETAITATLKKLLIESAGKITAAWADSTAIE